MNEAAEKKTSWRNAISILLLIAGCFLVLLSVLAIWLHNLVLDSDRYVETVAPLSNNQAIDDALADRITGELFQAVNVERGLQQALPERINFLAAPLTERIRSYTRVKTYDLLQSDRFNELWINANRSAHTKIVALLTGEGDKLSLEGDKVVLDLNPVMQDLTDRFGDTGQAIFGRLEERSLDLSFVIFESSAVAKAQTATDLLSRLSIYLPLLALLSLGGSLWLSYNRRLTLLFIGAGIAAAMIILLLALNIVREYYLGSVAALDLSVPAAEALFDTIVRFLKEGVRWMAIGGLIITAAAAAAGPSRVAVRTRNTARRGLGAAGSTAVTASKSLGPVGVWIADNKRLLQAAGIIIAALVLLIWSWPGSYDLLTVGIITAAYIALVEFLARAGGVAESRN